MKTTNHKTKYMILASTIFSMILGVSSLYASTTKNQETIVFAAGCFWGVEKYFDNYEGIISAESGYVGGNYDNPTYKKVLKYRNSRKASGIINYTEGVKVVFDNTKVDATTLIKSFWELHDPTQLNAQGNDRGNNYRSALYYTTKAQHKIANETKKEYQALLTKDGYGKIVTEIQALEKFYNAEEYHQNYLKVNPSGYCPNHETGVKFKKDSKKIVHTLPLGGKEILVITSPNYCPYCEKFKKNVSKNYKGTIPMRTVLASSLKGFDIKSKIFATPTILFIEDAKEVIGHVGYMDSKKFYNTLGAFKLGKDSQAYNVAFHEGTDAPGCKQYKIFNNTPDGVFIDKLSGEILFDTKERFNSGTGWLSFYKAADGAVIEKEDNSFGMKRVALVSKISGIHLGHVFDRQDGSRRFCIDATVLEFIPRAEVENFSTVLTQ